MMSQTEQIQATGHLETAWNLPRNRESWVALPAHRLLFGVCDGRLVFEEYRALIEADAILMERANQDAGNVHLTLEE
jgi:hypothetical protein